MLVNDKDYMASFSGDFIQEKWPFRPCGTVGCDVVVSVTKEVVVKDVNCGNRI